MKISKIKVKTCSIEKSEIVKISSKCTNLLLQTGIYTYVQQQVRTMKAYITVN